MDMFISTFEFLSELVHLALQAFVAKTSSQVSSVLAWQPSTASDDATLLDETCST